MATTEIEIENHTRSVLHFPVYEEKEGANGTTLRKEVGRLVLGDSADRNVAGGEAKRHHIHQPSPRVTVGLDELKRLDPKCLATLFALEARGDITIRGNVGSLRPKASA